MRVYWNEAGLAHDTGAGMFDQGPSALIAVPELHPENAERIRNIRSALERAGDGVAAPRREEALAHPPSRVAAVMVLFMPRHNRRADAILADPVRTPGVLNPDVTQANIRSTICHHGWTETIRPPVSYTNELKRKQMRLYRETGSLSDYQEDQAASRVAG